MIVLPIKTLCFWWYFRPNQINIQMEKRLLIRQIQTVRRWTSWINMSRAYTVQFTTQFHMKISIMINWWLPDCDTSCCHWPEYRCVPSNWNYTERNGQQPTNKFATFTQVHFISTTKLRNITSGIQRKVTIFVYIKISGAFYRGNYISLPFFLVFF